MIRNMITALVMVPRYRGGKLIFSAVPVTPASACFHGPSPALAELFVFTPAAYAVLFWSFLFLVFWQLFSAALIGFCGSVCLPYLQTHTWLNDHVCKDREDVDWRTRALSLWLTIMKQLVQVIHLRTAVIPPKIHPAAPSRRVKRWIFKWSL